MHDATKAPVAGVRVTVEAAGASVSGFTDPSGVVAVPVPGAGPFHLTAEKELFYAVRSGPHEWDANAEIHVVLERPSEHAESMDVTAAASAVSLDNTAVRQTLSARDVINVPYPNSNDFRSALRAMPGMVRDQRGGLHLNGAAEEQTLYTLNGFQINNPLTGRFDSRLSVESVQSVEAMTGNLAAEFGKGSAGALAVRSQSGGDRFRPVATNFFPGIENRKGWTVGDWQPRVGLSGPLSKGRAWFSHTADVLYVKTVVRDRPKGDDRYSSLRLTNLTNVQVNLTPGNVLQASLLANHWDSAGTGLSAIDPRETTVDRGSRQWFFSAKDQAYLANRALVEFGYAGNVTSSRENPQATGMLQFTPEGKRGNHYISGTRDASRHQGLVNVFLPSFEGHQVKAGGDLHVLRYEQDLQRTGFENLSAAGVRTRQTVFGGTGRMNLSNTEAAFYVQDSWRARPGLVFDLGLRTDWDRLVARWSPAPRLGVAWAPRGWEDTKLYAGVGQVFDGTTMRLFGRPLDQYSLTTYFEPDGRVTRGPALLAFAPVTAPLDRPRAWSYNAGAAHAWKSGLSLRIDALRRRGSRGFAFGDSGPAGIPGWAAALGARSIEALYYLGTFRRDRYDSVAFTARQVMGRQYEWAASYTRSRALSNAVVDVTADDPTPVPNNMGPLGWDAPHRFTGWGYLPLPRKNWAMAYFADWRSGFPYSVQNEFGAVQGTVNAQRFPRFFELNLHLERRFQMRGHRWAFRLGCNNLTGRINPDTVNTMILPAQFYGGVGRALNLRIRWLGRQ